MDGKRQGGAVAATNWQDLLDFLAPPASGPRTHEPAATPPKPAPAGRPTISTFPIAPEPKLVTYAPGFSYWVVEPFFPERFKPDSGVVVFLDADEPNRLRGLGYYGGEYDSAGPATPPRRPPVSSLRSRSATAAGSTSCRANTAPRAWRTT